MNWMRKHRFLMFCLIVVIIGFLGAMMTDAGPTTVTKENCDKITGGMTGEEVIAILGEKKSITSQSEVQGVGKAEYWHYQKGMDACAVIISDGKVTSKTWTSL